MHLSPPRINAGESDENRRNWRVDVTIAFALAAVGFGLYLATLAPTVTWGDDVTLTLAALKGELHTSAGSHPTWVWIAHFFGQLPFGEPAYRVNLVSAVAGAVALGIMYRVLRMLEITRRAAIAGVIALGISHTFWAHAVRAEVYTLTLATLAATIWAALAWRHAKQSWRLVLLGLAVAFAFATHVIVLLFLPGIAWVVASARPRKRDLALLGCTIMVALSPFLLLLWRDNQTLQTNMSGLARWALLTFEGYEFAGQMFRFSLAGLLRDAGQWLGYTGFQFVGFGLPLAIVGFIASWRLWPRVLSVFVGLLYGFSALFAFAYDVGDRYVFFLPSYLLVVIWLALGVDVGLRWLEHRWSASRVSAAAFAGLVMLLVAVPVLSYRFAPDFLAMAGLQVRQSRYVPGVHSRYFLLWPPKAGYYDARRYAEAVLSQAPANALVLAEPILASPLQYLQTIESQRTDVIVRFCCWDVDETMNMFQSRPVVLADIASEVYPVERLRDHYEIVPLGAAYALVPLPK